MTIWSALPSFPATRSLSRLVFYEALMKRYGAQLQKLNVPEHIDKGDELRLHLEGYFAEAKRITGDYETVCGLHPVPKTPS